MLRPEVRNVDLSAFDTPERWRKYTDQRILWLLLARDRISVPEFLGGLILAGGRNGFSEVLESFWPSLREFVAGQLFSVDLGEVAAELGPSSAESLRRFREETGSPYVIPDPTPAQLAQYEREEAAREEAQRETMAYVERNRPEDFGAFLRARAEAYRNNPDDVITCELAAFLREDLLGEVVAHLPRPLLKAIVQDSMLEVRYGWASVRWDRNPMPGGFDVDAFFLPPDAIAAIEKLARDDPELARRPPRNADVVWQNLRSDVAATIADRLLRDPGTE